MITSKEFKSIFKLKSSCVIPKSTLIAFEKQISGAYLLYLEISNIGKKKFKNIDGTLLQVYFKEYYRGFQNFVYTLGSRSKFEIYYIDEHKGSTPFWTYTKYPSETKHEFKNAAYKIFESQILMGLKMKYIKYGFTIEYRDYATTDTERFRCHPNAGIWWDGLQFNTLFYKNDKKLFREISHYDIEHTISNRSNIWTGDILEPIQKIINRTEKKLKLRRNKKRKKV